MKMPEGNSTMKMWLPLGGTSPLHLDWLLRRLLAVALGGLFFWAGLQKLVYSVDFIKGILAYRLLPRDLVWVTAAALPWVELATGLLLMVGVKRRSCLFILAVLLGGFMVIMLITMARGLKINCGCGLFQSREVGLVTILEDAVFLAWAGGLYWWELLAAAAKRPPPLATV
jgi:putative oxidoreductase